MRRVGSVERDVRLGAERAADDQHREHREREDEGQRQRIALHQGELGPDEPADCGVHRCAPISSSVASTTVRTRRRLLEQLEQRVFQIGNLDGEVGRDRSPPRTSAAPT